MPTLTEILARLAVVPTTVALLGLAATAGLIVAITDWRACVFALAAQYVLAGLLLTRVIRPVTTTPEGSSLFGGIASGGSIFAVLAVTAFIGAATLGVAALYFWKR
jgi:hypothetical protein